MMTIGRFVGIFVTEVVAAPSATTFAHRTSRHVHGTKIKCQYFSDTSHGSHVLLVGNRFREFRIKYESVPIELQHSPRIPLQIPCFAHVQNHNTTDS